MALTSLLGRSHTGLSQPAPGTLQGDRAQALGCQGGSSDPQDTNNLGAKQEITIFIFSAFFFA